MVLRSFAVLLVATIVAVAAAIFSSLTGEESVLADRGERVLPDLAARANDVAAITVTNHDGTTEFVRHDGGFVDASGFPVRADVVRDLLASLAVLTIVESKTDDPSRYADLDLAEPDAEEGAGTGIVLSDDSGDEIVRVVAGRKDYTVGGRDGGQYVRTGESDLSYLVRGSVELPVTRASWFETTLFETKPDDLVEVAIAKQDGGRIVFRRDGEALALVGQPSDLELDSSKRDRLAGVFDRIDFVDVRKAGTAAEDRGTLRAETTDGLAVSIKALSPEGRRDQWVRISVESVSEESKPTAEALAQKVDGYEFRLPAGALDPVGWEIDDLLVAPQS